MSAAAADLAQAIQFAIDVQRVKELINEMSPILTSRKWFNAACDAENVLDGLDELSEDMEKVVRMLRDKVRAEVDA